MHLDIVCGMCKILNHTISPTSVPYHLMPYALVIVVVILPVLELEATYENCVIFLIFKMYCWLLVSFLLCNTSSSVVFI